MITLEVCANSYQSAMNGQIGGAHRIELCRKLSIGGITPSAATIKKTTHNLEIPIYVLIRPRDGNFVYTNDEFELMKSNIALCKAMGCEGIVSGILRDDNEIDISRTRELIELSKPLKFTFHRAFDLLPNLQVGLNTLKNLGVDRVLTSGAKRSALEGLEILKDLAKIANDEIIIMPGAGITSTNAQVFKSAQFKEIHASCSKIVFGSNSRTVTDVYEVRNLLRTVNT